MEVVRVSDLKDQSKENPPYPELHCFKCGISYSADAADYFILDKDHIFECCDQPMSLVVRETRLKEVDSSPSLKVKVEKRSFRVFVERCYIATDWFDVVAENQREAQKKALRAARSIQSNCRETAIDNGWRIYQKPIAIKEPGVRGNGCYDMTQVMPGVFHCK